MYRVCDFSKHEYIVRKYVDGNGKKFRLDKLESIGSSVGFINTEDKLIVTGDFSDWVFSQSFIPEKGYKIHDASWLVKLSVADCNAEPCLGFDWGKIIGTIQEFISLDNTDKDFWVRLLGYAINGDTIGYGNYAYGGFNLNHDFIPGYKKITPNLLAIFDAFEEICRRVI